jgi:hypothetical protein
MIKKIKQYKYYIAIIMIIYLPLISMLIGLDVLGKIIIYFTSIFMIFSMCCNFAKIINYLYLTTKKNLKINLK